MNKLPEKWCIKVTKEHHSIIAAFYNKQCNATCYSSLGYLGRYLSSHNQCNGESVIEGCGANLSITRPTKVYPEITFEQFNEHVLKNKPMCNKIIGYKCPYDILDWCKDDIFIRWRDGNSYHVDGKMSLLPAKLVETWEPVYGNNEVIIHSYKSEYNISTVKFGCKVITLYELEAIKTTFTVFCKLQDLPLSAGKVQLDIEGTFILTYDIVCKLINGIEEHN